MCKNTSRRPSSPVVCCRWYWEIMPEHWICVAIIRMQWTMHSEELRHVFVTATTRCYMHVLPFKLSPTISWNRMKKVLRHTTRRIIFAKLSDERSQCLQSKRKRRIISDLSSDLSDFISARNCITKWWLAEKPVSRPVGSWNFQGTTPVKKNTTLQDRRKILSGESAAKWIGCVAER